MMDCRMVDTLGGQCRSALHALAAVRSELTDPCGTRDTVARSVSRARRHIEELQQGVSRMIHWLDAAEMMEEQG